MQFSYTMPTAQLGQVANCDPEAICSLTAPLLAQIDAIEVADNDAGAYSVTIVAPEGTFSAGITVVAQTIAQIADQLAAAVNAVEALQNIVQAGSDGVSAVTLAFLHAGFSYTVSVASASADLVLSSVQEAGGDSFPLGIGVVDNGGEVGRLPAPGDVAFDILGITVRSPYNTLPFGFTNSVVSAASVEAGYSMSVMRAGSCWVSPEVAVAANDPVFIRVTATGAEKFGAVRNDSDGGDAVAIRGRFRSAASAGGLARIEISQP